MVKPKSKPIIPKKSEPGEHLSLLSQYLIIIVPFVCKIIFETIQNLKKLSNEAAYKYTLRSGFWNEGEENHFEKCFDDIKNKSFKRLNTNASNSCNLESDFLNSYLDKIFAISKNISNNFSDNKRNINDIELKAIADIMECLYNGKLNISFLNKKLTSNSNVEKFVESWAQELKREHKKKNTMKFDKNIYENPYIYLHGLFSKNPVKQQQFKQCMETIKNNLCLAKKVNPFKKIMNTLLTDSLEETIINVLQYIQKINLTIPEEEIYSNRQKNQPKIDVKGKILKELMTKKFNKKTKLKQNTLMNLCEEAFREDAFLFPKLTLINKNKSITEIPQWEIQKLFKKYIKLHGDKVDSS